MDKIKFLMTDTDAATSTLCRQALEQKGVEVTVVERTGRRHCKRCWPFVPMW